MCRVWGGQKKVLLQVHLEYSFPVRMHFARSEHRANLVHDPGAHMVFQSLNIEGVTSKSHLERRCTASCNSCQTWYMAHQFCLCSLPLFPSAGCKPQVHGRGQCTEGGSRASCTVFGQWDFDEPNLNSHELAWSQILRNSCTCLGNFGFSQGKLSQ